MPTDMNPRRELTYPSEPTHNNGYDNIDFDYILRVSDTINTPESKEYIHFLIFILYNAIIDMKFKILWVKEHLAKL